MKIYFKPVMLLALVSLFSIACIQAKGPAKAEGGQVADFQLQDTNQNNFTLSDYKDKKPVLLFFWTTWCPFCRTELKALNNQYYELLKDSVEVVAVNVGEPAEKVGRFLKGFGVSYRVLLDVDSEVAIGYKLIGVPTYIILNKQQEIVFRGSRFPEKTYKELVLK